ncbi:MAG: HAD family hydrolase [Planctomycetes bacterium]|nr:HAD family hydrolase [Planctomycetota bacterium]
MNAPAVLRPAAFLDRDGTLIEEVDYLTRVEQLRVLPGVPEALIALQRAGYVRVLVSNQSGVARGLLDEPQLERIHAELLARLRAAGADLELVLYCPHLPGAPVAAYDRICACRKPEPGLLLEAARRLPIDLARSIAFGDSLRDLDAAARVGARGVLVRTGKGEAELARAGRRTLEHHADLAAAVRAVLAPAAGRPIQ